MTRRRDGRTARVRDLERGSESYEPFDQLVVATGGVPARPPLPGVDAAAIFGVQVLDDGFAIRRTLEIKRP